MKRASTLRVQAAAMVLALAALAGPQAAPSAAQGAAQSGRSTAARRPATPIPPLGGIGGLKNWFNANDGYVRTVFLLSPT